MRTVTIPKKEYRELVEKKRRYEYLKQVIAGEIFTPPPTKSRKEVLGAFSAVKKYNQKFIKSLEGGLRRSSHFK